MSAVTPAGPALERLGRFTALLSKKPYDRAVLDGARRAKEAAPDATLVGVFRYRARLVRLPPGEGQIVWRAGHVVRG